MRNKLIQGLGKLDLKLNSKQIDQLHQLLTELLKWNRSFNLTAIDDPDEALKLHLLDSLAIVPFWRFNKTLDVGTGAGFPGLPLAIALPDQEFHLLDSNSKKIRFIRQQIHHLGLKNVVAHHSRVQDHKTSDYDAVVSRAFASMTDFVTCSEHLLAAQGRWMAMKGVYSEDETSALPASVEKLSVTALNVPGLHAERCLVELKRRND